MWLKNFASTSMNIHMKTCNDWNNTIQLDMRTDGPKLRKHWTSKLAKKLSDRQAVAHLFVFLLLALSSSRRLLEYWCLHIKVLTIMCKCLWTWIGEKYDQIGRTIILWIREEVNIPFIIESQKTDNSCTARESTPRTDSGRQRDIAANKSMRTVDSEQHRSRSRFYAGDPRLGTWEGGEGERWHRAKLSNPSSHGVRRHRREERAEGERRWESGWVENSATLEG